MISGGSVYECGITSRSCSLLHVYALCFDLQCRRAPEARRQSTSSTFCRILSWLAFKNSFSSPLRSRLLRPFPVVVPRHVVALGAAGGRHRRRRLHPPRDHQGAVLHQVRETVRQMPHFCQDFKKERDRTGYIRHMLGEIDIITDTESLPIPFLSDIL